MAMMKKTWSISGLSVELGIDRRTLAKRLGGLRPAETKGTSRRFYMADVLKHLEKPDGPKLLDDGFDPVTAEYLSGFISGFFEQWADPLAGYLWKATKPFPQFTADNIFRMMESIWKIQAAMINQWFIEEGLADEEIAVRVPCVIESLRDPKQWRKAIKNLEKTSRVYEDTY